MANMKRLHLKRKNLYLEMKDEVARDAMLKSFEGDGEIICVCEDNRDYSFTDVTDLTLTVQPVRCHGFVTFGTKGTVTVDGYAGSDTGDDINDAEDGETWEFSVWAHNGKGFITWANKGVIEWT